MFGMFSMILQKEEKKNEHRNEQKTNDEERKNSLRWSDEEHFRFDR